jgi:hypothetical protein
MFPNFIFIVLEQLTVTGILSSWESPLSSDNSSLDLFVHLNCFLTLQSSLKSHIQDNSQVIMSPMELKMQPTIHLEGKSG